MEKKLGRRLESTEVVHHRNGIIGDNRLENLALTTQTNHYKKYHSKPISNIVEDDGYIL